MAKEKELWVREAKSVIIDLGGYGRLIALPKRFRSGAIGWYASGKVEIEGCPSQVGLNIVVIGTKDATDAIAREAVQEFSTPIYPPDAPPSLPGEQNGKTHGKRPAKRA